MGVRGFSLPTKQEGSTSCTAGVQTSSWVCKGANKVGLGRGEHLGALLRREGGSLSSSSHALYAQLYLENDDSVHVLAS